MGGEVKFEDLRDTPNISEHLLKGKLEELDQWLADQQRPRCGHCGTPNIPCTRRHCMMCGTALAPPKYSPDAMGKLRLAIDEFRKATGLL